MTDGEKSTRRKITVGIPEERFWNFVNTIEVLIHPCLWAPMRNFVIFIIPYVVHSGAISGLTLSDAANCTTLVAGLQAFVDLFITPWLPSTTTRQLFHIFQLVCTLGSFVLILFSKWLQSRMMMLIAAGVCGVGFDLTFLSINALGNESIEDENSGMIQMRTTVFGRGLIIGYLIVFLLPAIYTYFGLIKTTTSLLAISGAVYFCQAVAYLKRRRKEKRLGSTSFLSKKLSPSGMREEVVLNYGAANCGDGSQKWWIQSAKVLSDETQWLASKHEGKQEIYKTMPHHITDSAQFLRLVKVSSSGDEKLPILENSDLNRALCYVTGNMYLFRTAKGELLCFGAQKPDRDEEVPCLLSNQLSEPLLQKSSDKRKKVDARGGYSPAAWFCLFTIPLHEFAYFVWNVGCPFYLVKKLDYSPYIGSFATAVGCLVYLIYSIGEHQFSAKRWVHSFPKCIALPFISMGLLNLAYHFLSGMDHVPFWFAFIAVGEFLLGLIDVKFFTIRKQVVSPTAMYRFNALMNLGRSIGVITAAILTLRIIKDLHIFAWTIVVIGGCQVLIGLSFCCQSKYREAG